MSKSDQTLPNRSVDEAIQEEALRMARAIQKPGQTKEQTKLIAQGIAKGIEMYKKQQSAKARERDKARKRALKLKQPTAGSDEGARDEMEWFGESTDSGAVMALLAGGGLFAVMAVLHLVRVFMGWSLVLGPWTVPVWASLVAALLLMGLSSWFFYKASYPH